MNFFLWCDIDLNRDVLEVIYQTLTMIIFVKDEAFRGGEIYQLHWPGLTICCCVWMHRSWFCVQISTNCTICFTYYFYIKKVLFDLQFFFQNVISCDATWHCSEQSKSISLKCKDIKEIMKFFQKGPKTLTKMSTSFWINICGSISLDL